MKTASSILLLVIIVTTISCQSSSIKIVSTTPDELWVESDVQISDVQPDRVLKIDRSNAKQVIEGFGACFNELGWDALSLLTDEERQGIMREFFEPGKGGNFSICRMPLGANDFSRDWYSYNEEANDFAMTNFSIENDLSSLVPYIHLAKDYNPHLKVWASPWSPPSWMKYNKHYACAIPGEWLAEEYHNGLSADLQGKEGTNMFIQDPAYFKAYALYFSNFIDAYKAQDIDISMVMPQNEWNSCQVFPSCTWTAGGLAEFIGNYLGPAMEEKGVDLMLGTMERPTEALVDTVLNHPEAKKYVKGVGFQWAGKDALPGINQRYPQLTKIQTVQECGDGKNDWKHCLHSWELMKHYLKNGVSSYLYWNMALKKGGISRWGWSQNSLVTVNPDDNSFDYNYEYYLLKHVSHFVELGATLINTNDSYDNALVFENPDKTIVAIINNPQEKASVIRIELDDEAYSINVAANSFTTVCLKN